MRTPLRLPTMLAVLGSLILVGAFVFFNLYIARFHNGVDAFPKIKEGMTKVEVEAVLGVPVGTSDDVPLPQDGDLDVDFWGDDGVPKCYVWQFADGEIRVGFGVNGDVKYASCVRNYPPQEPFVEKVRRWLGI